MHELWQCLWLLFLGVSMSAMLLFLKEAGAFASQDTRIDSCKEAQDVMLGLPPLTANRENVHVYPIELQLIISILGGVLLDNLRATGPVN